MYPLLLIAFLPQVSAFVDCRIACLRCKENKEHPLVLEVHCAMCNECKQRRNDRDTDHNTPIRVTTNRVVHLKGYRRSNDSSKEHHHENAHENDGHSHEHFHSQEHSKHSAHSHEHSKHRAHSHEHSKHSAHSHEHYKPDRGNNNDDFLFSIPLM